MAKFVFKDSEPISMDLIPPGDYLVEIATAKFSLDPKSGADKVEIKCLVDMKRDDGVKSYVWETIPFTEKMQWKMDSLLRCCNVAVKKDQELDLTAEFLVGLRGIVKIHTEEYEKKKYNKIKVWYSDKQKFTKNNRQTSSQSSSNSDLPEPTF